MELQQYVHGLLRRLSPAVHRLQQVEAVYRLDQGGVGEHHLELVGLQVAYEMPFQPPGKVGMLLLQCEDLFLEFLRAALSEAQLPGPCSFNDGFEGVEFGNCHQLDVGWQFLLDVMEILFYHITCGPVSSSARGAAAPGFSGPPLCAAAICSWAWACLRSP